jgi:hypothetical protein
MGVTERPTVLMDVTAKWAVDAAFFLALAAAFLLWGVIDRSAARNLLSWAFMAIVAMLIDRMSPILPDTKPLADEHDRPPAEAVRRTVPRYAAGATGVIAALVLLQAAIVVVLAPPGFFAGWMTAYGVSRLRSLAAAREIERTSGVRLSVSLPPGLWRRRPPVFYATPCTGA